METAFMLLTLPLFTCINLLIHLCRVASSTEILCENVLPFGTE